MALFSTRAKSASKPSSQAQSSTVLSNEEFKRRAKNRLIGSFVLVVFAVLGFTWLLDSQPRPAVNDVPVVIPSQDNAPAWPSSSALASAVASSASVAAPPVVPTVAVAVASATSSSPSLNSLANLPVANASSSAQSSLANASTKPNTPVKTASESKFAQAASMALSAQEKDKQKEKLQEKEKQKQQEQDNARKKEDLFANAAKLPNTSKPNPETAAASSGQFIIQVGAYSDVNKAKEIKSKLEAAGLTAFTQNVKSNGVDLIRVRVGPFASKNAAEQNTAKVKALGLSAIVSSK